tara:strand:+ start:901 stop:1182 length:282 start_codon:yes stop_codon:yes gene_type:complete
MIRSITIFREKLDPYYAIRKNYLGVGWKMIRLWRDRDKNVWDFLRPAEMNGSLPIMFELLAFPLIRFIHGLVVSLLADPIQSLRKNFEVGKCL